MYADDEESTLSALHSVLRTSIKAPSERVESGSVSTASKGNGVNASIIRTSNSRKKVDEEASNVSVWFPWYAKYKLWWSFVVCCTIFSTFYETYQAAFAAGGQLDSGSAMLGYALMSVFVVDMGVNFNLAYYDDNDEIVWDRRKIARNYLSGMFWIDLVGWFPFYAVALAISGDIGTDNSLTQYLGLLRVLRLVRLHRLKLLYDIVQYSTKVSFMALTLSRNFAVLLVWTHINACIFFFIAMQFNFDPDATMLGGFVEGAPTRLEKYVVSLYWSITTFTTVGYGDYSPVNEIEQIFGMIYMLLNIIIQAWVIGSITLLIGKQDEATGDYREALERLNHYAQAHDLDPHFYRRLKTQVKLDFNNRELSDEEVLNDLPLSVRRKVLRKLYLPSMLQTSLLQGVRQQFVDTFLLSSHIEIFSPGEEILVKGTIAADLFLLIGGVVQLSRVDRYIKENSNGQDDWVSNLSESISGSVHISGRHIQSGEFINPIGFFTESPQMTTVRTVTVCKILTLPRAAYKHMIEDYPEAAQQIVLNLLRKVKRVRTEMSRSTLPTASSSSSNSNTIDDENLKSVRFEGHDLENTDDDGQKTQQEFQLQAAETTLEDLVQAQANKLRDDRTTRFLFAASRGDTSTLNVMLNQGFDPNTSDYDNRTALMLAAMSGQEAAVTKLLEVEANPNKVDVHGATALFEAAIHGHKEVMDILLGYGADLCVREYKAASALCEAVYEGDAVMLKRLLEAGIDMNAGDYDGRRAVHIAASEGNLAALKILVESGADLSVRDRWNNSLQDEARRAKAGHVVDYLNSLQK